MAKAACARLQDEYFIRDKGLWAPKGQNPYDFWWTSAVALEAVIEYMTLTGDLKYVPVIDLVLKDDRNLVNSYYDDTCWWAISCLRAYDYAIAQELPADDYLKKAIKAFEIVTEGWDDKCGGGIWWSADPNADQIKGSIENEQAIVVASRLHERVAKPERDYKKFAQDTWDWLASSNMIDARHLVGNDVRPLKGCAVDMEPLYTYTNGVILGALIDLWKVTGDPNLRVRAEQMAEASIVWFSNDDGVIQEHCELAEPPSCDKDQQMFKGIYVHYAGYLYSFYSNGVLDDKLRTFILKNADSIWKNARLVDQFGVRWTGPYESATLPTQISALLALNQACRFQV